jgi:hypothetical protein
MAVVMKSKLSMLALIFLITIGFLFYQHSSFSGEMPYSPSEEGAGPEEASLVNADTLDSDRTVEARPVYDPSGKIPLTGESGQRIYLPILTGKEDVQVAETNAGPRLVNVPYFDGDIRYPETAVFWFGRVNAQENYADVRVGYNQAILYVNLAVFDRQLWYDPDPSANTLADWDAVSLYLIPSMDHETLEQAYRFDAMLNWWEDRSNFQAAYRGSAQGWSLAEVPFTTITGWRGSALNDNSKDERGWVAKFRIPFTSLGWDIPPANGDAWKLGIVLHDRDDRQALPQAKKTWPESFDPALQETWGDLKFGMPVYNPLKANPSGESIIRQEKEGTEVPGASVGGGTICGDGLSFWYEWGDTPSPGSEANSVFNIQNQSDVADWPCFSKYYLSFPLDGIPRGKTILSARLILHQSGNSGGGDWGIPEPSYIQLFSILEDWDEKNLTWNNAPLAYQNFPGTWVDPVIDFPGWPGIPWEWDATAALVEAYSTGGPFRLALYSADSQYHSGKYFVSSYTGEWNSKARPTLIVTWGE